jgi:general secretion pathway protein K
VSAGGSWGPMRAGRARHRQRRGIALISVLWITAFLTVAAGALSREAREDTQLARNLVETAQARQAAAGAIDLAILGLLQETGATPTSTPDSTETFAVGEAQVHMLVADESGRIDLNAAPVELLAGLLQAVGVEDTEAAALADAIADWRDPDDLRRLNGAEDADYRRAGKAYDAKDRPFESVEEVQLVLGMTPDIYRAIRPALTVYSRQPGINPAVASRLALLAVPGTNPDDVERYVVERDRNVRDGLPPPAPPIGDRRYLSAARARAYTLYAEARMPSGALTHLGATVRLTRSVRTPYTVLDWQPEPPEASQLFAAAAKAAAAAAEADSQ